MQPKPVSLPGMHPLISAASGSEVASHHFDGAVFNAFKAVEERVRNLTGNRKTKSGSPMRWKPLMASIFDEQDPAHLIVAVDCGVVGRTITEEYVSDVLRDLRNRTG